MNLKTLCATCGITDALLYDGPTGNVIGDGIPDASDYRVEATLPGDNSCSYAVVRGPAGDYDVAILTHGEDVRLWRTAIHLRGNGILWELEKWAGSN
jgi:hypothetical protein